jgi:hypothetical protein
VRPDGAGRVGLIEGDGVRDGRGVHRLQVAALPHGPDDGRVLALAVPLDRTGELTCDWRDGDLW